ncbi:MAG: hypothetical protein JNL50_11905 [Phycisphaerae bacterium]|nr:hypothetical protein [Phycisphaerae bacterium]
MRGAAGERGDRDEGAGAPAWLRESWSTLLARRATLWWYRRGDRHARHQSILARGLEYTRPTLVPPLREAIALQLALRLPGAIGRATPGWVVIALASLASGVIHVVAAALATIAWLVRVPLRLAVRVVRRVAAARDAERVRRECFVDVAPGVPIGVGLRAPASALFGAGSRGAAGKRATDAGGPSADVRLESYEHRGTIVRVYLRRVGDLAPGATWWVFLHARHDTSAAEDASASLLLPFHHVPRLEMARWPGDRVYRAEFDVRELGGGAFRLEAGVYDPTDHASMVTPAGAPGIELGALSIESSSVDARGGGGDA